MSETRPCSSSVKNLWQYKALGDVCVTSSGGTPLKLDSANYDGGTIPWLMSGEVGQRDVIAATKFITDTGLANSSAKLFPPSSVLVAMYGATAGEVGILRFKAATNQAVCGILPNENFVPEFLYYFLLAHQQELASTATGNAQPNISQAKIRALQIPLMPRKEQKRLVSILDEAFEGIATVQSNTESNLANNLAFFAATRNRHLETNNSQWKKVSLGEISDVQSGGTPLISVKTYWNGDIPWYSSGELNSIFTSVPKRHITSSGLGHSNAKVFPQGSLLIGMYDTAALKMSVLDRDAAFNQAIAGVKPNDSIDLVFLLHAINSQKEKILNERRGTRQKNLSLAKIKDIHLRVPPIAHQRKIVALLENDALGCESLSEVIRSKIAALDELKQSLLHQAFSGNL